MSQQSSPPVFSVLVPTHNRASILPRALDSVLAQSFGDFELLVVDDASSDRTSEVVEGYDDPRIRYILRSENGGAAASRNTGIREARGSYLALLDDDDEYEPDFLLRTHATFLEAPPDVGFTWCGIRWVRDTPLGVEPLRDELWQPCYGSLDQAYRAFLANRRIGTNSGLALRRRVFEVVEPFDELFLGGAEDTDFLIRLVRRFQFRVVPAILLVVHLHGGANLRTASAAKAEDYERIIEKNLPALESDPALRANLEYKTGWLHYHAGARAQGRSHMLRALRLRPSHVKAWGTFLLCELLGSRGPVLHRRLSSLRSRRQGLSH